MFICLIIIQNSTEFVDAKDNKFHTAITVCITVTVYLIAINDTINDTINSAKSINVPNFGEVTL